jgi:hypothetical protein
MDRPPLLAENPAALDALTRVEVLYTDLDGTLLARGGSVVADGDGLPAPMCCVRRDIESRNDLRDAADNLIARCGAAWIVPDQHADRDPSRMRVIARAAEDLVHRLRRLCPSCRAPGYGLSERRAGLPCEECGAPTDRPSYEVWRCWSGARAETMPVTGRAPMAECTVCHP